MVTVKQHVRQVGTLSIIDAILTMTLLQLPTQTSIMIYGWAPLALGIVIGLFLTRRNTLSIRDIFRGWMVASGIYFGLLVMYEVLKYQPWHILTTDGGIRYSLYEYRSVYGSSLIIFFAVILLIGMLMPLVFSRQLWSRFRPFGTSRH